MALNITEVKRTVWGDQKVIILDVDFDNAYAAGGEAFGVAEIPGLEVRLDFVIASPKAGLVFEQDYTNSKLKALVQGIDTDAAGAGVIDDFPVTAGVGTTAVSVGLTAGDPRFGGLKEVAAAADLSTVTDVRVVAIGV